MLYRPGTTLRVWNSPGYDIDYLIVPSLEAEMAARAKGWTRLPGEVPEQAKLVWGDHDGDQRTGGSPKGENSTAAIGARRRKNRRR